MSDKQSYYYIRVKETFFDDDVLKLIEAMQDGYLYSNILLKLYLKSLKLNGKLMVNERIPYNPNLLATITGHQVGTIEKALNIFKELDLIEILDNGAIYMLNIQELIGKSSTEADRKRAYRNRITAEKSKLLEMGQMSGQCPLEIEKDKDIDIEIDIEDESDFYGEFRNVKLTNDELIKLKKEYPDYKDWIENLSSYMASTGKSYKNHYATIRSWAKKKSSINSQTQQKSNFHNFNQREYDNDEMERKLLKKNRA